MSSEADKIDTPVVVRADVAESDEVDGHHAPEANGHADQATAEVDDGAVDDPAKPERDDGPDDAKAKARKKKVQQHVVLTPAPPVVAEMPASFREDGFNRNGPIENLRVFDPFAEADEGIGEEQRSARDYIHIRIQQRNGRKTLTTVQGLPTRFDQKKILRVIKKKFACNGTTVVDKELGEVIQLQGDQRKLVKQFLIDKRDGLELDERDIKIHGF